jgi:amidase
MLRTRELSPLELVDAAASRIEDVEPKINALPIRFLDEARDHAKSFRAEPREHPGWLAGLPIAVKDYNDVAGQLTTYGSPLFAKNRAATDDRTIATLRANGGIPIAKSNVPEFAGSHTFNPVWGITRNPWNFTRSAGGSSGGAAAALATGEVWLANGSCLGGSLRIPASFCGIVGLRPSPGVVPRGDGLPAFDDLWVEGPMARNVPDVALMLDAMAAFTHHDPLSRRVSEQGFQAALRHARAPRRLAFSSNFGLRSIDGEVARITRAGVHRFFRNGLPCRGSCAGPFGCNRVFSGAARTSFCRAAPRPAPPGARSHKSGHRVEYREGTKTHSRGDHPRTAGAPCSISPRGGIL